LQSSIRKGRTRGRSELKQPKTIPIKGKKRNTGKLEKVSIHWGDIGRRKTFQGKIWWYRGKALKTRTNGKAAKKVGGIKRTWQKNKNSGYAKPRTEEKSSQ